MIQLVITLHSDLRVEITGPIDNEAVSKMLLAGAEVALNDHHRRLRLTAVQPARLMPQFPVRPNGG